MKAGHRPAGRLLVRSDCWTRATSVPPLSTTTTFADPILILIFGCSAGKLRLLLVLVRLLDRRHIGSTPEDGLIRTLLLRLLFPEARLLGRMAKQAAGGSAAAAAAPPPVPMAQIQVRALCGAVCRLLSDHVVLYYSNALCRLNTAFL